MRPLGSIRLRDGAVQWGLFFDVSQPGRVIEIFLSPSWSDHLRHHERVGHDDQELTEKAYTFHLGPGVPKVSHFTATPAIAPEHHDHA
jgi:hypothetical protein